jgi:hypothetical protein
MGCWCPWLTVSWGSFSAEAATARGDVTMGTMVRLGEEEW